MEGLVNPSRDFWRAKRVLVTGHTGFKGAWLALWLRQLGAVPLGLSLEPETSPSLAELARIDDMFETGRIDIRDGEALANAISAMKPDIVMHLAAQTLVRRSYAEPALTFETNVMGTVHLLEAVRQTEAVRSVVIVTSDKCYENKEWHWSYREDEALGGHDPYSASKGCAELITSAWRRSFFTPRSDSGSVAAVASARAGNVIGGGDWAADRLVPDCIRALEKGAPVMIRNPHSTRPWQHVLEPLSGYLLLAERLWSDGEAFAEGWNFGPAVEEARPVSYVVDAVTGLWGDGARWELRGGDHPHEAGFLSVDASKARARLNWKPRLRLDEALAWTTEWYKRRSRGEAAVDLVGEQIARYQDIEGMNT